MKTRFELEEKIMAAWHVVEDIKTISFAASEKPLSQDEIMNLLIGLEALYTIRFDDLFRTFEKMIGQGNIT
jgi:hypothetical protein